MDDTCAALVGAKLVRPVDPRGVFNLPGAVWAEPDIAEAAYHLRRLADDRSARLALAREGYRMAARRLTGRALAAAIESFPR